MLIKFQRKVIPNAKSYIFSLFTCNSTQVIKYLIAYLKHFKGYLHVRTVNHRLFGSHIVEHDPGYRTQTDFIQHVILVGELYGIDG